MVLIEDMTDYYFKEHYNQFTTNELLFYEFICDVKKSPHYNVYESKDLSCYVICDTDERMINHIIHKIRLISFLNDCFKLTYKYNGAYFIILLNKEKLL